MLSSIGPTYGRQILQEQGLIGLLFYLPTCRVLISAARAQGLAARSCRAQISAPRSSKAGISALRGAYRVYEDPAELLRSIDEVGGRT
jgi:hypothetical protein